MTAAKRKPATQESDGPKIIMLRKSSNNLKSYEKSNCSGVIPARLHRSPKNLKISYFHPDNGNRKWRLIYVQKLIKHRYGSLEIPESDDTGYFEVVARNISNLNLFIEWSRRHAPWASSDYVAEIFNDINRHQPKYDLNADKAAKILNVQKHEYFKLNLGRGNIGYVGSTKKEREKDASNWKRKMNKAQMMRTRRANGVKPRNEYRESVKSEERWIKLKISRAKYFRDKKAGLIE